MQPKRFDPSSETTKSLFNSEIFKIPRYQRSYSWGVSQLDDFANDFLKGNSSESVFLGTIILDKSNKNSVMIVDGQQRLLTLTITFAVIRDILKEEIDLDAARDLARDIQKAFVDSGIDFGAAKSPYRIKPSKDVESIFERYIQIGDRSQRENVSPDKRYISHKLIINAYLYIRKYITKNKLPNNLDLNDKLIILKRLVESLSLIEFIRIDVYDGDLAFSIFESHNSKGADLLVSDLVKNYLYDQLKMPEDKKEELMQKWDDIIVELRTYTNTKIDKFLYYHMQTYEGKFSKSQLFKKIKSRIKDIQPTKFLKEIEEDVSIFKDLINSNIQPDSPFYSNISFNCSKEINVSLEGLATFNVDQCYIFLLSLFRNNEKISSKFLKKITNLIENFTFRYSKISHGQANVLEKIYSDYAIILNKQTKDSPEIFGGRVFSSLEKEFQKQDLGYDAFAAKFIDLDYSKPSQKKLIQYIFKKMENYKSKGATALSIRANIDHIFPQNPPVGNKKPSNIHKIGNLVPVDSLSNSKIGNKLPQDKFDLYESISNILLVKDLLKFLKLGIFNEKSIGTRSIQLAQEAYSIVWNKDN